MIPQFHGCEGRRVNLGAALRARGWAPKRFEHLSFLDQLQHLLARSDCLRFWLAFAVQWKPQQFG